MTLDLKENPDRKKFQFFGFTLVVKLRNFDFESHWNTLICFDKKNNVRFDDVLWVYYDYLIWFILVKQCLIWFKVRCLNRILAISWDLERFWIFYLRNLLSDQNLSRYFLSYLHFLFFFFWHCYRNSFKLKIFLMILRYIEIL